jgi:hypothetical protein
MTLLFEDLAKAIEYMKKIISKIDRSLWSGEGRATDKCQPSLAALENNMFQ